MKNDLSPLDAFIRAAQAQKLRNYRIDRNRAEYTRARRLRSVNFLK